MDSWFAQELKKSKALYSVLSPLFHRHDDLSPNVVKCILEFLHTFPYSTENDAYSLVTWTLWRGIISSDKPTSRGRWCLLKIPGKYTIIWHKTAIRSIIKCSIFSSINLSYTASMYSIFSLTLVTIEKHVLMLTSGHVIATLS